MARMSAQGWLGYQLHGVIAQPNRRLADAFQTAFDGIARAAVVLELGAIHRAGIGSNASDIVEDIGEADGGIVARRHAAGPVPRWRGYAAARSARATDRQRGRAAP